MMERIPALYYDNHLTIYRIHTLTVTKSYHIKLRHTRTHTVPVFQHGPSLDTLLCRFGVESPYITSIEAQLIRQNCPLKTKLAGNLLQCLQVNYSILKTMSMSLKYLCRCKTHDSVTKIAYTSWALLGIISNSKRSAVQVKNGA